ncbi:MAG: hypothetical protein MR842_04805 [Clostridiales bacterium]|nr:hypothetical protein [Clostridiales bacterium]MDY4007773.1 hypothetical protein [Candidatus Limiplasma sp.]
MERSIVSQATSLIKAECCNAIDGGYCILRDKPCPQIAALRAHRDGDKLPLCQWFHDAFLLDPRYKWLAEALTTGHDSGTAHCKRCGKPMDRGSNRQAFCPTCAEVERKLNKAKVMRNLRAKQKQV